jgi:hypothetical protein
MVGVDYWRVETGTPEAQGVAWRVDVPRDIWLRRVDVLYQRRVPGPGLRIFRVSGQSRAPQDCSAQLLDHSNYTVS